VTNSQKSREVTNCQGNVYSNCGQISMPFNINVTIWATEAQWTPDYTIV